MPKIILEGYLFIVENVDYEMLKKTKNMSFEDALGDDH